MSDSSTPSIGTPVQVDVASIERELRSLWKSASGRSGEGAVIRACSCNLVVIAQDRDEAEAVLPLLGIVSEFHPSRTVIAYREGSPAGTGHPEHAHLDAWITALCAVPMLGRPQVCSESITIAAPESAAADVPNTVLSLLVPDLQVFLYWRSFEQADRDWADRMARFSNLLIVDSHQAKADPQNRERLLELLNDSPGGIHVRDLNWSRLTPWRDLVSQFFDHPFYRDEVHRISDVNIERALATPGNIPTRTLLLTGWLASSLHWKRLSAERLSDRWISRWNTGSGEATVRFGGTVAAEGEHPGISSIEIRTTTGNTFKVVREPGSSVMTATVSGTGPGMIHSVPQESTDEPDLLVRELSLNGQDVVLVSALTEALALEKSFR